MKHFFDIGANIGNTFDWFLLKTREFDGWSVWCFEPSPRNLPPLIDKARELAGRYTITVCPFGIGGEFGAFRLFETSDPIGDSFKPEYWVGAVKSKNNRTLHQIMPAIVPLADFILTNTSPGDEIVLKLDCEGSEYAALRNLLDSEDALKRCTRIFVEWHDTKKADEVPAEFEQAFEARGRKIEKWDF